jgi:hypothetical protein
VASARTFGRSPHCINAFTSWFAAESRPRGLWYLKLRPRIRTPFAASALAIVSPSNPS